MHPSFAIATDFVASPIAAAAPRRSVKGDLAARIRRTLTDAGEHRG
jgi:hypothetical protein